MNNITDLMHDFISFAKGMPAFSISWEQIKLDVKNTIDEIKNTGSTQTSPFLTNIRMPVYSLAFSVEIVSLSLSETSAGAELNVLLKASIHTYNEPSKIIRTYTIETTQSSILRMDIDVSSGYLFWQQQGHNLPNISAEAWPADVEEILKDTPIPEPRRQNYLDEVERQIFWLTGPSFIRLVTDILPKYNLSEYMPWFMFKSPLRVKYSNNYVIATSKRGTLLLDGCVLETVDVEPDPDFPYNHTIPEPTLTANHDYSVYSPKSTLFKFMADKVMPAVMVSDSGGGVVKWKMTGSVGLKALEVSLQSSQSLDQILSISSNVEFVAGARAWIDGPSGSRLSLASASIIGDGEFGADIKFNVDVPRGTIKATLFITHCKIDPHWDLNTPLNWPIDAIASELLNHVSKKEVSKFTRRVIQVGEWKFLGLPFDYLETMPNYHVPIASGEGLQGVSGLVGVKKVDAG